MSIAELWTVIFNQKIKYQLPHMQFDQISDHKHDKYLYGTPSTELSARPADVNTQSYWASFELLFYIMWDGFY